MRETLKQQKTISLKYFKDMETKKKYFMCISGEDYIFTERYLTDTEAELVGSILSDLNTNAEGCEMKEFLTDAEIEDISKTVYPEKPKDYVDWNKLLKEVMNRYPKDNIFWQEHMASCALDVTNERFKEK